MHAVEPAPRPEPEPRPSPTDESRPRIPLSRRVRFGWIGEILFVLAIYYLYDWLRDQVQGPTGLAFRNARQIVHAERVLHIYWEHATQHFFLPYHPFISFENIWYGSIHFVMPVVVMVWLYRKAPARYVRWRNVFFLVLGFGLLGFWVYPVMPPRLMPAHYDFVDTAYKFFGLGKPAHASKKAFGNLYAAVPSLHLGWSSWCVFALYPQLRRWWSRALLVAYPFTIALAIVVSGNHWLLDAVAGVATTCLAYIVVRSLESLSRRWRGSGRSTRRAPRRTSGRTAAPSAGGAARPG